MKDTASWMGNTEAQTIVNDSLRCYSFANKWWTKLKAQYIMHAVFIYLLFCFINLWWLICRTYTRALMSHGPLLLWNSHRSSLSSFWEGIFLVLMQHFGMKAEKKKINEIQHTLCLTEKKRKINFNFVS